MSIEFQSEIKQVEIKLTGEEVIEIKSESLQPLSHQMQAGLQRKDSVDYSAYNEKGSHSKTPNHVDIESRLEEWTEQEEKRLLELHNLKGNKWVQIARQLGRNDNAVKNHYHSKFRKILRKINNCISNHLRGQVKPLKNSIISKIIQTAEKLYSRCQNESREQSERAYELKNKLLLNAGLRQQQVSQAQINQIKKIVSQIENFNRKNKGSRKNKEDSSNTSNRYKGKEILSLLTENTMKNVQIQMDHTARRNPTPHHLQDEAIEEEEPAPKKVHKKSMEGPTLSPASRPLCSSPILGNFPQLFYMNEGIFPYPPMYYPFFPDHERTLFSGRGSSFTYISNPHDICHTLPTWHQLNQFEAEPNRNKNFGSNSSLQ